MPGKRTVYFDCFSGISGDMFLGALVDLGVELKGIRKGLASLGIKGYKITSRRVKRNGIDGTKVDVVMDRSSKKHYHHSRSYTDIKKIIESSTLPEQVKLDSIEIFLRIGKAEAKVHRTTLNKIHFHEVGAVDSIVDIVGGALGMSLLNADRVYSSALNTGEGMVKCAHGTFPVPAPATLRLLHGIPCYSNGIKKELTTPTGAALIGYYAEEFRSLPNMVITDAGYGAGGHRLKDVPNLLRVMLGEMKDTPETRPIKIIECNIDDMNPEFYDHVMSELFRAGAADVFFTPTYMKKNRPGTLLSVLVPEECFDSAAQIVLAETSTFGIRHYEVNRTVLDREEKAVKTSFGKVRVKLGSVEGQILRISPEYEDCRKIALRKKIPLQDIYEEALRLAKDLG